MKKFVLLLAILLAPLAHAQTVVSGTVEDPANLDYSWASLGITFQPTVGPPTVVTSIPLSVQGTFTITLTPPGAGTYTFAAQFGGIAPPIGTGPQTCTASGITVSGSTQTVPFTCPALTNFTGGSGAGNPAPPACALQIANSLVTAFATSSFGGFPLAVNSCTAPTALTVPYSLAVAGPRPWVDVTSPTFGADPTGSADSTTAIQNAINYACSNQSLVFFPAGAYKVSQPQSSNAPILVPGSGCNGGARGLYMLGEGTEGNSSSFVPQALIFVNNGASPGLGPLLALGPAGGTNGVGSARIKDLALACYNQCLQGTSGGDWIFDNDNMTVQNPTQINCSSSGCTTDTAAVVFYGGLEIYFNGGVYINDNSPSGTNTSLRPSVLLSTDSFNHSAGIVKFLNTYHFGPVVDSALTSPSSGWGTVYMDGDVFEALGSQSPFVSQNFGSPVAFDDLNMSNVIVADSNPGIPLVYLNGGSFYNGINITTSSPTANPPATIEIANSGSLGNCFGGSVINGSGSSIPGCVATTQGGFAFIGPSTYSNNPPVYFSTFTPNFPFSGSMIQMARAGESNTSLEIDPLMGLMTGLGGTVGGYDASWRHGSGAQSMALSLALASPPTGISVTPASGGSLAPGSYTYGVTSAVTASNCNNITNYWLTAPGVASGTNLSLTVNWTLPANLASITGYCVLRNPDQTAATQAFFVSGSGSTSFTDVGTGGTLISGPVINNTFPATPQYQFALSGLTIPAGLTVSGCASGTYTKADGTGCGNPASGGTVTVRAITGTTASDTILSGDCTGNTVAYEGTVAVAEALPTPTTLGVPNCTFTIYNEMTAPIGSVTATTLTVNGITTSSTPFKIFPGDSDKFSVDASGTNWVVEVKPTGSTSVLNVSNYIGGAANLQTAINNCITAAYTLAAAGTCDLRALGGTQTFTQAGGSGGMIFVGDGTHAVTVIFPDFCNWTFTYTGSSATGNVAMIQHSLSRVYSNAPPLRCQMINGSATNLMQAMYATVEAGYYVNTGLTWSNTSVPTNSGWVMLLPTFVDNSQFDWTVDNYASGGILVGGSGSACCNGRIHGIANGNFTSGGPEVEISGNSSGDPNGVVIDMSMDHAGTGFPEFYCADTSTAHLTTAYITGYIETANADTSTIPFQINGCNTVTAKNIEFKQETASANQPLVSIANVGSTNASFDGLNCTVGCSGVTTAIQDNLAADCTTPPCNVPINSNGSIPSYSTLGKYAAAIVALKSITAPAYFVPGATSGTYVKADGTGYGTPAGGGSTVTVANGTAVLGTSAISSATCATVITVAASGVLTTDDIMADFNADPTSTTGYSPSISGMLTIIKYPTSGNVNFKVCNNTASSITPGAVTLNWRVVR